MSLVVKVSNFTTVKRVVVQTGEGQYFTQKKIMFYNSHKISIDTEN